MIDNKLYTLLKVYECRNYTRAAQQLSITQPAVSQHIKTLEEELRSYIQSFYRFSQIFIHRNAFPNPFKQNLLFADCEALKPWAEDCTRLKRWADYVFQFKNYAMALALYERIPSADRDAEILMHRAFCLECMHRLEEARNAYAEARHLAPESSWALDRWANCCRQTPLNSTPNWKKNYRKTPRWQ